MWHPLQRLSMLHLVKRKYHRTPKQKSGLSPRRSSSTSPLILFLLLLLWSLSLSWGFAWVTNAQPNPQNSASNAIEAIATVDPVPQRYQLGQDLYLENCASCHIAVPPAVLPTQTWQRLLLDSQHYGVQMKPLVDPPRLLVWNYLKSFSRPLNKEEATPYRIEESRYFKALHPKVKLPRPVGLSSCGSCHPSAAQFNFRRLTPQWENSH